EGSVRGRIVQVDEEFFQRLVVQVEDRLHGRSGHGIGIGPAIRLLDERVEASEPRFEFMCGKGFHQGVAGGTRVAVPTMESPGRCGRSGKSEATDASLKELRASVRPRGPKR